MPKPHPQAIRDKEVRWSRRYGFWYITELGDLCIYVRRHLDGWKYRELAEYYGATQSSIAWRLGASVTSRRYHLNDRGEVCVDWNATHRQPR